MPKVDVKDWNNKKVGSVDLPEEIFAYPYKEHLIHEAVRNYLASLRQGTHKVKNRSEVSGSGKKPFRQKGTGRARQGGNRPRSEEHTSELQSRLHLVCRLLLEKKKKKYEQGCNTNRSIHNVDINTFISSDDDRYA